jgi:hypothetical protein
MFLARIKSTKFEHLKKLKKLNQTEMKLAERLGGIKSQVQNSTGSGEGPYSDGDAHECQANI